jgi:hypothetical protein
LSTVTVIGAILYTIIGLTTITNFIRLFVESKKLKEQKKTPLIGRTTLTILLACIAEVVVIFLLLQVVGVLLGSIGGLVLTFAILFYIRTIVAYLVTWGLWSFFVTRAKKKELEKINQDKKTEAGQ